AALWIGSRAHAEACARRRARGKRLLPLPHARRSAHPGCRKRRMTGARVMPGRQLRVLIIDDEALARQRLEDLLREEDGVEIVGTAENGEAAIAAIRALRPDLVFLDVQMPLKTGLDVVREIGARSMPAT